MTTATSEKGKPSPSKLFYLVLLATAAGLVAAIAAGSVKPGFALKSNLVYRAEVGLAFLGIIYIVGVALWLSWYGKGFFELNAFGSGIKAPGAEEIEEAGAEVSDVGKLIDELQEETNAGLKELDERIDALEDERAG